MRLLLLPPVPPPDLPDWSDTTRRAWEEKSERVQALGRAAGAGRNFRALLDEARRLLGEQAWEQVEGRLTDRRFARAVLTVWSEDDLLARRTMTPQSVALVTVRARLSRLATIQAATLYAEHFDALDQWTPGLFAAVRDLVWHAVAAQPVRDRRDVVETLRTTAPYFADASGPMALARDLVSAGTDLSAWFQAHHLGWWLGSRLGRLARDSYYLAQIEAADPEHGDHPFLTVITHEVMARQKTERTDEDGLYFGHQVLTALTAKATRRPSDGWLEATLSFAGDPRMRETTQWRTWWARIPAPHVDQAVRWLQGLDLRAFLDGVKHYATDTYNSDMERMLKRRAKLLLGLHYQDRVRDVRLILGENIRSYVRRSTRIPLNDLAVLSGVARRDTAIVYVDCGDFSLIEGSHSFRLHVLVGPDGVPEIADRHTRRFTADDLKDTFPEHHVRRHGPNSYLAVSHQGFKWVVTALDFLRGRGVVVDERPLLTSSDYSTLLTRREGWY